MEKSVKPTILSCFGDIALAISEQFDPYLTKTLSLLHQASLIQVNVEDVSMLEFDLALKEGISLAYIGIIQGMKPEQGIIDISIQHLKEC